jgi:hypothetical protein
MFLEIDHVVPLEEHGRTELDNLWRLCSHHHRLKTYEGWKVVGRNGTRDLVPPDHPDPPDDPYHPRAAAVVNAPSRSR